MLKLSLSHNGHALSMHLHYSFTSSLFFCLAIFTQISHAKVNGFADSSFGTVDEFKIIQGSGNCPCSDTAKRQSRISRRTSNVDSTFVALPRI